MGEGLPYKLFYEKHEVVGEQADGECHSQHDQHLHNLPVLFLFEAGDGGGVLRDGSPKLARNHAVGDGDDEKREGILQNEHRPRVR